MNAKRLRPILALIGIGALIGTFATSGAAPKARVDAKPDDFTLTIATKQRTVAVGHAPEITAVLSNQSGEAVTLVPALDGSDMGRYPLVRFEVVPSADAPEPEMLGRCGNTNNIRPEDFVDVANGATIDPMGAWARLDGRLFTGPGMYTVQLTYDTREDRDRWYGFMGPLAKKGAIDQRLSDVPRMLLESNVLTIEVLGRPISK